MNTRTVMIPGTYSWRDDKRADWYTQASPFDQYLNAQGIPTVFTPDGMPFIWSTNLGGVGFGSGDLIGWAAAGYGLYNFCVPPLCMEKRIPGNELCVIAHSHALQVVLYAAKFGLKISTLVSVGSPVRRDMLEVAEEARPNIHRWLHLHSDKSDKWQWFGELFDGHLGVVREHPLADTNDTVPGVGHSSLLRDPTKFDLWRTKGWLHWLGGPAT